MGLGDHDADLESQNPEKLDMIECTEFERPQKDEPDKNQRHMEKEPSFEVDKADSVDKEKIVKKRSKPNKKDTWESNKNKKDKPGKNYNMRSQDEVGWGKS